VTGAGRWARALLAQPLVQPDARSCGAASLVVARAAVDEAYAELLVDGRHPATGLLMSGSPAQRFQEETLAMHRRVTGLADVAGRLQPPWPRALGTPPWAVARQLSSRAAPYVVRQALVRRAHVLDALLPALDRGRPVALFVGDRWLPRHVVLALSADDAALHCYDPGTGGVRLVDREAFQSGALPFGRWTRPWFVVRPRLGG
jgi:hypothetical protein